MTSGLCERKNKMMTHPLMISDIDKTVQDKLDQRFQSIAWALFLIMTGIIWLLPDFAVPDGLWPIGTGLILLGLNVVRALNDIETSGFTLVLGLLAVSVGMGNLMGVGISLLPILLIGIGALVVLRALQEK
jgi:hypothetical protein